MSAEKTNPTKRSYLRLPTTRIPRRETVKGGFDRKNLFQQAENGFDRLFGYNRQLTKSFEYYNTMKNGSISDQLNMQEQQIKETTQIQFTPQNTVSGEREKTQTINSPDLGLSSVLGILTPGPSNANEEQPIKRPKKKKSTKRGFRR